MSRILELTEYDVYKDKDPEEALMNKLNEVIEKINELEERFNTFLVSFFEKGVKS